MESWLIKRLTEQEEHLRSSRNFRRYALRIYCRLPDTPLVPTFELRRRQPTDWKLDTLCNILSKAPLPFKLNFPFVYLLPTVQVHRFATFQPSSDDSFRLFGLVYVFRSSPNHFLGFFSFTKFSWLNSHARCCTRVRCSLSMRPFCCGRWVYR